MRYVIQILRNELRHLARSSFKTFSLVLFIGAAAYGLQNGYGLYQKHNTEIADIAAKDAESIRKVVDWFDEGKTGPEDRPWVDVTTPFWAIWHAPSVAVKAPSALMPFTIGQAEEFGYYKQVTFWSTTFDSDLAEEIANPERLASGTLDFSFVVIYLLPILLIVLLFNVGGLERDYGFHRLIEVHALSTRKWLLARFSFYFLLLFGVLLILMLPYAVLTGAIPNESGAFISLFLFVSLYAVLWFSAFYFINATGKGSADHALKMVAVWLLLCIVLPGSIHQLASLRFPASYMTEYIDANREDSYKLWELPPDSLRARLLASYPVLANTEHGRETIVDAGILSSSSSGLVNELMRNVAQVIERRNEAKNGFIQDMYWINPVSFCQNGMNALAETDYHAYRRFRSGIQDKIDKKVNAVLIDSWNRKRVNKEAYLKYIKDFNQDGNSQRVLFQRSDGNDTRDPA